MLGETKILQGDFAEARKFYERAMKDPKNKNAALAGLKNLEKTRVERALNHRHFKMIQ